MINDGITFFIVFEGIANPIPADAPVVENIAVFIPITSPCTFQKRTTRISRVDRGVSLNYVRDKKTGRWGRSDGNVSGFSSCSADGKILPRPLIMPSVIEPDKPKGLPIATTPSPTLKAVESPIGNGQFV